MSMPLNKEAYSFLIEKDIEWLQQIYPEGGLEKSHIIKVLQESVEQIYGKRYKIK